MPLVVAPLRVPVRLLEQRQLSERLKEREVGGAAFVDAREQAVDHVERGAWAEEEARRPLADSKPSTMLTRGSFEGPYDARSYGNDATP